MIKRIRLAWLMAISLVFLTFPTFQLIVPTVAAASLSQLASNIAQQARARDATKHSWGVVASPNRSSSYNQLNAVATISANDIWAVGYYESSNNGTLTLTEHWNGTQWSVIASPNTSVYGNVLEAVAAVSSSDVWAVGNYEPTPGQSMRLIEHWNGTRWSIISTPQRKSGLYGVAAVSAIDVWAVGGDAEDSGFEHWNGTQWSIIPSPHPELGGLLLSVVAISASDVWAAGSYFNGKSLTFIEHWNGTQWSIVPSPSPGNEGANLYGLSAVSATNIWAVGNSIQHGNLHSLVEQWNGTSWNVVSSPNPGGSSQLLAVAAISATDVWTMGNSNGSKTVIEHWNGTIWSVIPSPNPGAGNVLDGVMAISASNIWAVGSYFNKNNREVTLISQYT